MMPRKFPTSKIILFFLFFSINYFQTAATTFDVGKVQNFFSDSNEEILYFKPLNLKINLKKNSKGESPYFSKKEIVKKRISLEKFQDFLKKPEILKMNQKENEVFIKLDNGKISVEGIPEKNKSIDEKTFKRALELGVNEGIKSFEIPLKENQVAFFIDEELKKEGVKEIIGIGESSYYGSPENRRHNIAIGVNKFNGVLLKKGEKFSFNNNLGLVDSRNGYKMELVITPEGTVPEYGGGICQVSSTVYRAALWSGLPIIERKNHSYAVSYYAQKMGHGMDATIYLGGPDLIFLNDTPGAIVIQSYVRQDNEMVTVFYGTNDGRKVEMEGPFITNHRKAGDKIVINSPDLKKGEEKFLQKAHDGFDTTWYRQIKNNKGETKKEKIFSRYKAVPEKLLTGGSSGSLGT